MLGWWTPLGRASATAKVLHGLHLPLSLFPLSQGLLSEEELAHLEQASAVATEVTSSIMRLKLEVEEKKRAISLLQTALVCEPDALACWEGGQRALSRCSLEQWL